ncbi:MAG: DUF2490 domain-containing protein [Simkaniaceae bacterium]|nr:DUF2490 domain-containing protein [Simkaniaceae bacterium]
MNQNGDFQIWFHDSVIGKLNPNWGIQISQEFRFGNDATELYQQFNEVMLIYYGGPSVEISPGYKQLYSKEYQKKSKWVTFCIPQLDLKFIFQDRSWKLENRNRIEYVLASQKRNSHLWVLRPLFNLDTPFYYKNRGIKFFLSDEFFWTEGRGINQNRLKVGFKFQAGKHTLFATSYLLRNLKRFHNWTHQNVLHLSIDFNF